MVRFISDDVLAPLSTLDVPAQLRDRLEEERSQDAIRKKEKNEAHLYTYVNVRARKFLARERSTMSSRLGDCERTSFVQIVGEECFTGHKGFDLIDESLAEQTARKFRIRKLAPVKELYELIGEQTVWRLLLVRRRRAMTMRMFVLQGLKPFIQFRLWAFEMKKNRTFRPTEIPVFDRQHRERFNRASHRSVICSHLKSPLFAVFGFAFIKKQRVLV